MEGKESLDKKELRKKYLIFRIGTDLNMIEYLKESVEKNKKELNNLLGKNEKSLSNYA